MYIIHHIQEFAQASGDHGVIVMTLGALVKKLPLHISEELAAAFAQLSLKHTWRYEGQRPVSMGNKWLQQNYL